MSDTLFAGREPSFHSFAMTHADAGASICFDGAQGCLTDLSLEVMEKTGCRTWTMRNISLENYTYEMMKTQYHDLFITTRTSIQDPSIRPPGGNRSTTFYIGRRTKKDWKVSCQPTMKRHFGYWRRTMRSLQERCLGGISNSSREKEKENQQAKWEVTSEVASNPFEKVALAGRPIWPMNIRIPTTRRIGEKVKERRESKENQNSNIPMMETKVIHPMTVAKEKADKKNVCSHCREDGGAARHPADCRLDWD